MGENGEQTTFMKVTQKVLGMHPVLSIIYGMLMTIAVQSSDHNVDSDAACRAGYHHVGADVAFDARREYRHDLHGVHRFRRVRIPGRDPGVDLPPALQHPGHYDLVSD